MALQELYGSREIVFTRTGAQATRRFYCEWSEAFTLAPKPGDPFPGWPALTVDTVRVTPAGQPGTSGNPGSEYTHANVEVDYSLEYTRPDIGEGPRITYDFSSEVLATTSGRTWEDTGDTIDQEDLQAGVNYPLMSMTMDLAVPSINIATISGLVGKINSSSWQGFAAETLLFEGATTTAQWNYETASWYFRVTYKFLWRPRSHNLIWRPPKRVWDPDKGDWARNADGTYQYASGDAGKGKWVKTDPLLYETADFSPLIPS